MPQVRKSTIRRKVNMPTTREIARLTNEVNSVSRKLKNLMPIIETLEANSRALQTARQINTVLLPLSSCPETDQFIKYLRIANPGKNFEFIDEAIFHE